MSEENNVSEVLSSLGPDLKKDILEKLLGSLVDEINDSERQELLRKAITGRKGNRQVVEMVEH